MIHMKKVHDLKHTQLDLDSICIWYENAKHGYLTFGRQWS